VNRDSEIAAFAHTVRMEKCKL